MLKVLGQFSSQSNQNGRRVLGILLGGTVAWRVPGIIPGLRIVHQRTTRTLPYALPWQQLDASCST